MEWPKSTKFSPSQMRTLKRQGFTVLVILVLFGSYFLIRVPAQRAFYVDRSFAALSQMVDRIENSVENAIRNGRNAINDASRETSRAMASPVVTEEGIRARLELIPNLRLTDLRPAAEGVTGRIVAPKVTVRSSGRTTLLDLVYVTTNEPCWEVRLETSLAALAEPVLDRRLFDDLAVLDAAGRCLFQPGGQTLRVAQLDLPIRSSYQTNMVDLAGKDQLLFAQPVSLGFGDAATGASGAAGDGYWLLCGIIEASRFRSQTLKMDYEVIVYVVSLALLLVVSWPLLDWSSIPPGGGVTRVRLTFVAWVSVLLFGLLTTFFLDQLGREQLRRDLDRHLEGLAKQMQDHFGRELDGAIAQLRQFHERFLTNAPSVSLREEQKLVPRLLSNPAFLDWTDLKRNPCPFFEMAFWADPNGGQQAKWTVREQTTARIDVSKRDYFKAIVNGVPWLRSHPSAVDLYGVAKEAPAGAAEPQPFAVQSIYSWNTGENLAILSIPWDEGGRLGIAAIDVRFLSLFHPVIAGGFGFCVVDPEGGVVFHSDPRRNLRENFIEECNQKARLRAAVSGRTTGTFTVSYLLAPHRIHLTPVPDTPWMLVVFQDERVLDTARLQIDSITGGFLLVYVLWLGLVMAGVRWLCRSRTQGSSLAWLWPDSRQSHRYAAAAKGNLLILLGGLLLLCLVASRTVVLTTAFLLPALALAGTARYLILGAVNAERQAQPTTLPPWQGCFGGRSCYLVAGTALFLLIAVFPAGAFFKASHDAEMALMLRDNQLDLARDLLSRHERIEQHVRGLGFEQPSAGATREEAGGAKQTVDAFELALKRRQTFLELRRNLDIDRCTTFFYNTKVRGLDVNPVPPTSQPPRLFAWLDGLRAPYGDRGRLRRRVAANWSPSRPWSWGSEAGEEVMVWQGADTNREPPFPMEIRSELRSWPRPPVWSLAGMLPVLGLLAMPFLAWWVLGLLARRYLLLAGLSAPGPERIHQSGWYLLLGPPAAGKTGWLASKDLGFAGRETQRLDLRRPTDRARLGPRAQKKLHTDPDRPIVIDHFEFGSDDAELTRRKLALLRDLVATNRRGVVVVSNLHPIHFARVPAGGDEASAGKLDAERRELWLEVLGLLRRIDKAADEEASTEARPDTVMLRRQRFKPLWDLCTDGEREVLHHIACRRLVRSDCPGVEALLARGLLTARPVLALTEPRFAQFVRRNHRPLRGLASVAAKSGDWWQALRGPTLTLVAFGALFLFLTQPERWNQMLALTAAFISGFGVLRDLATRGAHVASGRIES